jgi:Patatin phospholipase
VRKSDDVRELASWGCLTRMHVVRLLAPRLANEDHTKDVDFSPSGIRMRWEAGYASAQRAIAQKPWQGDFDPLDGVISSLSSRAGSIAGSASCSAWDFLPSQPLDVQAENGQRIGTATGSTRDGAVRGPGASCVEPRRYLSKAAVLSLLHI